MRLYVLLVIILMKRMFPRHIWQVCSAPTPVLITAEITNIHFHLNCSNNESSFSSNSFIHFSSFSLSLISSTIILIAMTIKFNLSLLSLCYLSPLQLLNTFNLSLSLSVHQPLSPSFVLFLWHKHILIYFTFSIKHLTIWTCILSRKSSILVWYWCFKKQIRFCSILKSFKNNQCDIFNQTC